MSLDVFKACIKGYSDHLFDMQLLCAHQGYWAGYFVKAKRPKTLQAIIDKMIRSRDEDSVQSKHADSVDVQEFMRTEELFKERLNALNK